MGELAPRRRHSPALGEYVEPGYSGRSIDKRPIFREMIQRIRERQDIDYVVVYALSRFARNVYDLDHYATVAFSADFCDEVRKLLDEGVMHDIDANDRIRAKLTARLTILDTKEGEYLDLVGDPAWPRAKLRAKIIQVQDERDKITGDRRAVRGDRGRWTGLRAGAEG